MTTPQIDLTPIYLLIGFLVFTNLGTIVTWWLNSRQKKEDSTKSDIKELLIKLEILNGALSETNASVARLQGVIETAMPQVFAVPKLKEDVNALFKRLRNEV